MNLFWLIKVFCNIEVVCILRSPSYYDAFWSARCAEYNGRPETLIRYRVKWDYPVSDKSVSSSDILSTQ